MFLPYSGHVLLPTKTSRAFSQFPDNSLFIVFRFCGYIWWCLMYSIVYMLLVFFFDRVGAGSVRAVAAVGPTVRCPVIDDVGYQLVAAKRFTSFYLGRGVRERWCVAHPCLLVWENPPMVVVRVQGAPSTDGGDIKRRPLRSRSHDR